MKITELTIERPAGGNGREREGERESERASERRDGEGDRKSAINGRSFEEKVS